MLATSIFQKLALKILTFILTLFLSSNPVVSPSTEAPIAPVDKDGVKLTFAALADPQVSNYMLKRYPVFLEAMEDLHSADNFDALVIAGDIVENGLAEEYQIVYDSLKGLDCRYLIASGNHDIRLRAYKQSVSRFTSFANALNNDSAMTALHFSEEINGYKFIILGSDKTEFEEEYLSPEQLGWIESEIASADGSPVFVICHQPLKFTHGLPDTWGSPIDSAGSVGDQNDELKAILTKYDNVFYITGHLHTGFGEYTYETVDGLNMINLPSLCIENKDGGSNGPGIGFMVEVYDSHVLFRARNFALGEWLPDYDIDIPVSSR